MRRILLLVVAVLLVFSTNSVFAQGLLGRGSLSGQYLLVSFEDHGIKNFDGLDNGARAMLNLPVLPANAGSSPFGVDLFVTGYGYELSDRVGPGEAFDFRLSNYGVESGLTLFGNLSDWFKPFGQVGVQHSWFKSKATDGVNTLEIKESDTSLIYGGGAEISLIPNTAWQSSVMFGSEMTTGKFEFRNDLIVHANECLFFRFSVIASTESDFFGGFGGGFSW